MRPLAIIPALALAASALVAAPAQAAGGTFTIAWDAPTSEFVITASAGMSAFGESEELAVGGGKGLLIAFIVDGDHTFTYGSGCTRIEVNDNQRAICRAPITVAKTRLLIDMRAATAATTTAVAPSDFKDDPLSITFLGGSGPDYVQGGEGNDDIYGGGGDDDLFGGLGDDRMNGDDGSDDVWGEEGNDSLGGGPGNDRVTGDEGVDSMTGGPGVDTLDSEDGIKDSYVDCDNEPGLGTITYDVGLDLPFDCPVILAPTQPREVIAEGADGTITVSWKAPEFDGNDPSMAYELRYRLSSQSWQPDRTETIAGSETSTTLLGLAKGLYYVSMRAVTTKGSSEWTAETPAVIGTEPPPPTAVTSVYVTKGNATLSWTPPPNQPGATFEIALRARDKKDKAWLAWTTLPGKVSGSSLAVGDDLRLLNGRTYQFRVRTVLPKVQPSAWAPSAQRFVGELAPLEAAKITRTGKGLQAGVTAPGAAWMRNVDIVGLAISLSPSATEGVPRASLSVVGSRYTGAFTGPITRTSGCWVGLTYRFPGTTVDKRMTAGTDCPG